VEADEDHHGSEDGRHQHRCLSPSHAGQPSSGLPVTRGA
jgi:hypothetical protein